MTLKSDQTAAKAWAEQIRMPTRLAVVLVVDLVESVRLMESDEEGVINRWQSFVDYVSSDLLTLCAGRLVKSLGDGLMAEFGDAPRAFAAACGMHDWMANQCEPLLSGDRLRLRAGLHVTRIYEAAADIYGAGVNLAARITTLASAGETVASVEARDQLVDTFDAAVDDLGDCHLKHVEQPVRVYRLGPARQPTSIPDHQKHTVRLSAAIAIIPFSGQLTEFAIAGVGDIIADGMIGQLSQSTDLHVVSRLSSACFRGRDAALDEIAARLQVRFVVSGSFSVSGSQVLITAELADAASGAVTWSSRIDGELRDLLSVNSQIIHALSDAVHRRILESAVCEARTKPIPTLKSYELFLAGITMMHRASAHEFDASRQLLESLTERHARIALPFAWLGKWHVLHSIHGQVTDLKREAAMALQHTGHALDLEPTSALALAMEGFVFCHLKKDLDVAEQRLAHACELNPSEGFAWLFLAVTQAFKGDSTHAVESAERAIMLSPIDPLRYYYESLMGSCEFGAGRFSEAIRWCEASRRRNRQHLSTLRILIAAYAEAGEQEHAVKVANELRRLRPDYTVASYESHSVAAMYPFGQRISRAMRSAGIP